MKPARLVFTGGGTGGHMYPGLSVLHELEQRVPCTVLFVGTRRGLEASVVPQKGYAFKAVWISGLRRGRFWANLLFPVKVVVSFLQSLCILMRFRPAAAVGTGAYVSWPVMSAAGLLRVKTVILEQNEKPGLVTRVLSIFADQVHLSFESSRRFFRRQSNLHFSGNPTRGDLDRANRTDGCRIFGLDPKKKTLLVFGGSQGAKHLNHAVLRDLEPLLSDPRVQVLWATGPKWHDAVRAKVNDRSGRVRTFPFIEDMPSAYAASDVVLCRSGAGTVAEIARVGQCAVFVPFPGAAGGHQDANALVMAEAEAAVLMRESELKPGALAQCILPLMADSRRRNEMGRKAKTFARPDAARTVAEAVANLITAPLGQGK